MRNDIRVSGVDIVGGIPWGTHFCQFYQTKEDLIDILVPYFKAGLENNEFCMWVTSQPLDVQEAKEALRRVIPDLDVYLQKGQIEIIPYTHWYVKDGVFDSNRVLNGWVEKLNQALASGYDGLRLTGNTFWLEKKDWNDFVDYEEEVDRVLGNYNMIALCTYCLDKCNATEIIDVVINHQFTLIKRGERWEQIESSKRKQTEEVLLRKGEELNEAQRIAHVGSWYWDARTDANIVSDELLNIFGQDCLPFQKQNGTMYPPESWDRLNKAVQKAVQTGIGYELDLEALHADGHTIWITTRGEVVRDANGEITGLHSTVQDITERRQAEDALRRERSLLESVMQTTDVMLILLDPQFNFLWVNSAYAETCQMKPEEMVSKNHFALYPHAENEAIFRKVRDTGEGVFYKDKPFVFLDQPERGVTYWDWSLVPVKNSGGSVTGLVFSLRETTKYKQAEEAIKESEEKYRGLFSNMSEGFGLHEIILDTDGKPYDYRFLEINDAFEKLTGISREKALGRTVTEVLPDIDPYWIEIYGRVALTGEAVRYENYSTPLGKWYDVYSYSPRKNQFAVMFVDITERKQEDNRVRRYNLILEGMNRIFSNVVQTNTEEELANTCLDVALKVTGGGIGFINLLGDDGLMHDIAISEGGWDQCLMYDKTGHRRPPGNFLLHGLYSHVVNSKKSFFTNDPPSHPKSIGLPYGHPPLTSFLGVPLVLDGKTMGMIGVANRESGYSLEQQEDLEAIASAVIQALHRKRSEEVLHEAYEQIQMQSEELNVSNEELQAQAEELHEAYEELRESEESERARFEELALLLDAVPAAVWIAYDTQALNITGNKLSYEWLQIPEGANASKSAPEGERPETFRMFKDGVELLPVDMPVQMSARGTEILNYDFDFVYPDGRVRHVLGNARPLYDKQGNPRGSVSAFIDITERRQAEEALKIAHDSLEAKVKERTAELEKAYKLLEQSERGLAEAQKMAHLGNWDWNIVTDELYWSNEVYRIFGLDPLKFGATYDAFLSYVHPDDRGYVDNVIKEAVLNGKPYEVDYRIISADGRERTIHAQGEVFFDEKHTSFRMRGIVQDITDRKKAEKALEKMDQMRIKEIHHRIKNNLQVISSLLDLQAETFSHLEVCKVPEVMEAFKESQSRVASMALIHEELYEGKESEDLDFTAYLRKLTAYLLNLYNLKTAGVNLKLDFEEIYLNMDTAIPLGIIVNELVSNSLKHAFPHGKQKEIRIILQKKENFTADRANSEPGTEFGDNCEEDTFIYALTVADNGKGIPEEIDLQNAETLGLQLVNILVEQIDGCIKLKRSQGTEFTIWFNNTEI